jgi:hypothetical protein
MRGTTAGLTNVVGGMLVALDEQLLRSTPRAEVLVKRGTAIRGLSAAGGTLLVGLPEDPIDLDAEADGAGEPTDAEGDAAER